MAMAGIAADSSVVASGSGTSTARAATGDAGITMVRAIAGITRPVIAN